MSDPRHPVTGSDLLLQWRPDWLTAAVLLGLTVAYLRARLALRNAGVAWPVRRDLAGAAGVLATAWLTCGFPEARAHQLMWVWTSQQLALLLVVPALLMAAQPIALAEAARGPRAGLVRFMASRPVRVAGHPTLTLLYVPLVTGLLFFGGVGNLAARSVPAGWALHVVLLAIGAVIALPLVREEDGRSSLAVGVTVAIGVVELLLDAVPGLVLRLETHVVMPAFTIDRPAWSSGWLHDQQTSGAILWTVAELLDLPFLVLALRQWMHVERKEAIRIDAELDRAAADDTDGAEPGRLWWLDHPDLRARYGRGE